MRLPLELEKAIDSELASFSDDRIRSASAEITAGYRRNDHPSGSPITSKVQRVAYAAVRMPATYAATYRALEEFKRGHSSDVSSLLDLGSGPGTTLWAAAELFPNLQQITLVEQDQALVELGKRLATGAEAALDRFGAGNRIANWTINDLRRYDPEPHDLVISSYVLGELDARTRGGVLRRAWAAAREAVVIVEPGTPDGYSQVIEARSLLLDLGAHLLAPCPHYLKCPMWHSDKRAGSRTSSRSGFHSDWCHFAVRVERSRFHRRAKSGALPYEDEKYAYVIAAKAEVPLPAARIIRHPLIQKGHITFDLCSKDGVLRREVVSRKQRERYRMARQAQWGDVWGDKLALSQDLDDQ